jgi:hypothetical protein
MLFLLENTGEVIKDFAAGILQNVNSASITSLMARVREWWYIFWISEAAAASYLFSCRFLYNCCR